MKVIGYLSQSGNAILEFALILPILVAIALISSDLYNIHLARGYMEQSAHTLSSVLAMQNSLNKNSFLALTDQVVPTQRFGNYELIINKVNADRTVDWVLTGNVEDGTGICPNLSDGSYFSGDLPEEMSEKEATDEGVTLSALLVVQLCRNSDDLGLSTGLLEGKLLQAISVSRMIYSSIELGDELSEN